MNRLALLVALMVVAAPLSDSLAAAGTSSAARQALAQQAYRKWQDRQTAFWKKFDADMAGIGREMSAAFPESGEAKPHARHGVTGDLPGTER